jgi:hypothetical protein
VLQSRNTGRLLRPAIGHPGFCSRRNPAVGVAACQACLRLGLAATTVALRRRRAPKPGRLTNGIVVLRVAGSRTHADACGIDQLHMQCRSGRSGAAGELTVPGT